MASGIPADRIGQTAGRDWITFDASVDEAEALLKTKYHVYEHDYSGQPHVACEEYSLPKHLKDHIDFVTPSVHFDAKIKERSDESIEKRDVEPGVAKSIGQPSGWNAPKLGGWLKNW